MLPQEELVKLFSQNFVRPIASTLQIQQHKTFKEAIVQVVIIKRVKIQDGEIKSKKRENYKSKIPKNNPNKATYHHQIVINYYSH